MGKTYLFDHPMIRHSCCPGWVKVCLGYCNISWWYMRSEVECQACYHFSDGYSETRPTQNWYQNICKWIDAWLESWNKGLFDELVWDSYVVSKGYLGRACSNQRAKQYHCTFSILVLHGILRKSVRFIYKLDSGGGGLLPDYMTSDKTGVTY